MKKFYHIISVFFFVLALQFSAVAQNTFTSLNGPFLGNVNDLVRTSTGVFISATDNGLYRSTDGTTWTRFVLTIPAGGTATQFQDLEINTASGLIYAVSFQNIFTSADQGANWTFLTTTGLAITSIRRIEVAPNGNVWVAQINNTLYRANAATSTTFNTVNTFGTSINDLDIGPTNQVVVSTQGNSVQVSTNNGLNFAAPSGGLSPTTTVYSSAINSSGVIFSMGIGSIFRTTDSGVNYTDIKNNITEVNFFGFIEIDATNNVFVANNSTSKIYSVTAANSILATPAWTGVNYPAPVTARAGVFQSLTNWQVGFSIYAVAGTGDGGTSWAQISTGLKAYNAFGSSITPRLFRTSTNRLLMSWPGNGYFVSIDDGATWDLLNGSAVNLNRQINGFVLASDNSIIGYGSGGIVRSPDNSQNWTNQNNATSHSFLTAIGATLYSFNTNFTPTNIQTSVNNGVAWINVALSGMPAAFTIAKLASNTTTLYALVIGSTADGLYTINTTTGVCTRNLTVPFNPSDISVLGANVVAISGTSMAVSANSGTTWASKTISQFATKVWIADDLNFYVQPSTAGSFLVSNNAGATWTTFTLGDATGQATDAIFSAQGFAYLVGSNMAAQKSAKVVMVPRAPTNLNELSKNSSFNYISWDDNSTLESKYEVETSVGNNTSYQLVLTTGIISTFQNKATTTVATDAVTPTFVRVRAVNDAGASAYSNEISIIAMNNNCTPPASDFIPDNRSWTATAVADVGFTPTNTGPFTSTAANVTRFSLIGNLTGAFVDDVRFGMAIPAFGLFEIGANFNERCGITSISGSTFQNNGNGSWNPATKTLTIKWQTNFASQPFKGTTTYVLNATDPVPAVPTLTAYIYSSTEILLSWESSPFATAYDLERSLTSGSGFVPISTTLNYPATSFINAGLTTGQTYYYRIRAKNTGGNSVYSAEVNIAPSSSTLFRPIANAISENFESQQGVSWGDLDGDGDDDLAVPSFTNSLGLSVPPVFYQNLGNSAFQRMDLANLSTETTAISRGIALFDLDNDNDLDMLIHRSGAGSGASSILLTNNGNWNFTKTLLDQTAPTGTGIVFRGFAIADYDRDGFADAFLGSSFGNTTQLPVLALKNNGTSLNLLTTGVLATDLNSGMTLLPADYDNDGDQDLFVVNRFSPAIANKLFNNNGDGTFNLVTGLVFDSDLFVNCRTGSWGDIDNDGDLDLFVGTQSSGGNKLYRNNGNGTFTSLTSAAAELLSASGSAFGDLDNDGDLDLVVTVQGPNAIYLNDGTGVFTKLVTAEIFTSPLIVNVGGAFSDYDADGFIDFYTANASGNILPNLLYKNTSPASSSRNWIEVRLRGTASNAAALGARVTVTTTSPSRTQIREVMSSTGYGSQNSFVQHFGIGTATTVATLTVKWPNGGVQILTNPPINQVITVAEDVTGPTFTFTPANAATGIGIGNVLRIGLNEPGTPVIGKNIVVRKGSPTGTPIQTLSVTTGTAAAGNISTYTLAAPFDALTQYFISIDAGAFVDAFNNPSAAITPTQWSFTTADLVPPIITATIAGVPATFPKGGVTGSKFTITVTDNVAVASVIMSYRKVTATQFQTLTGVAGTTANTYDFPLQATFFDDMGMEYFFTAKDPSNNTTLFPATGNAVAKLSFSATTTAVAVAAGSQVADYKIISIPLELATPNIANIFADFGPPDGTQWKLLKYRATPQAWLDYPNAFSSVARGEGYFILSREGKNLKFDGAATAPSYTQANLFPLNLVAGFNLIGNPYTMAINWDDSRAGISGVNAIKVYQGGNYVDGNSIEPYSGGFVFANAAVTVPVKLKTSPNGGRVSQSTITTNIDETEWILPIWLKQNERQFNFGGVGMSPKASYSYDDLDDLAPPSPYGNFEMRFSHPEHFMKKFSRDVVPTGEGHTWAFAVETDQAGEATLRWDNAILATSNRDIYLFDVANQRPVNMKNISSYSFSPSNTTDFKVYFGKNAVEDLKPTSVFLGQVYPNPSAGATVSIPFNLPEATSQLIVQLEVYDALGKKVETLLNKSLPSGFYTETWDTSLSGQLNGMYFVRLSVHDQGKTETVSTKLLILK